jgi:hypothetical protein
METFLSSRKIPVIIDRVVQSAHENKTYKTWAPNANKRNRIFLDDQPHEYGHRRRIYK